MNYKLTLASALACRLSGQSRQHRETEIVLHLPAPPAVVFPLFGPVRETEWSPDWKPQFLFPGDPAQQAGAVFTTKHEDTDKVWVLDVYDGAAMCLSYVVVLPGMVVTKLDIKLKAMDAGMTEASVTYRQTGLSEAGDRYVTDFARDFPTQREHWEHAITHRLKALKNQ